MPALGKCFDHLCERLAPVLFSRLIEMRWIEPQGGKTAVLDVTEKGSKRLKQALQTDASELEA